MSREDLMVESEKEKEKKKVEGKKVRFLTCTSSRRIANLLMRVDNTITLMKHLLT